MGATGKVLAKIERCFQGAGEQHKPVRQLARALNPELDSQVVGSCRRRRETDCINPGHRRRTKLLPRSPLWSNFLVVSCSPCVLASILF